MSQLWTRVLVVVAAAGVAAAFALRDTAPVGHFRSAADQDRYRAAYASAMAVMPAPDETREVRTGFGVVRVYRFAGGDPAATPLLLLPGTRSGAPVFADNLPSLRAERDVWLLDLLGEPGMSVQDRPITSAADQAAWLHQTLAALPPPRFHVLGLSIGGWTAANLARHEPAGIASLVLLDPVFVYGNLPLGTIVRTIPASVPWLPKSWRDSFSSYTAGGAPVTDEPVAVMIEAGTSGYAMRRPAPSLIPVEELRRLPVPVLAVVAGRSVMHDPAAAVGVAGQAFGRANVRLYPEASHAVNGEEPDRIAADVREFLGRLPA
jgi:pimeloyl-ACP methyl ester carboxylesterase